MYDELNQLIRENNHELQQYVCYTYDYSGNIQSKTSHAWAGTVLDTDTYTYGNSQWGDLLTNYNGTAISYDASGNPLKWRNVTNLNWQGRKLTGLVIDTMGMQGMNFSYNADGIRTKKSHYNHNDANMYEVSYVLDGTKILSQTYSHAVTKETYTVKFFYDANDAPIAMEYDGNYYYYRTNIQGDIEGIYNANGTLVVSYSYDAWGNILSTTGTLADTVGEINPFRYRGYYFDAETGWYYLQSRYYDPTVGRFLNADNYISTGCGVVCANMFAYCNNNPVMYIDYSGENPWSILVAVVSIAIVVIPKIVSSYNTDKLKQYKEYLKKAKQIHGYVEIGMDVWEFFRKVSSAEDIRKEAALNFLEYLKDPSVAIRDYTHNKNKYSEYCRIFKAEATNLMNMIKYDPNQNKIYVELKRIIAKNKFSMKDVEYMYSVFRDVAYHTYYHLAVTIAKEALKPAIKIVKGYYS